MVLVMASELQIILAVRDGGYRAGAPISFKGVYSNIGTRPLALTFWWNRSGRLVDASGRVVPPRPGSVLPCGVGEEWLILQPGQSIEREEPLECTQPAGRPEPIGWSYALAPGTYRFTLIYESPPPHGFTQCDPHPSAFSGRIESNEIPFVVRPR